MSKKRVLKKQISARESENIEVALVKAMSSAGDTGLRPHVLESALRWRLHQLAESGIKDPDELKDVALRSIQFNL